MITDKRLKRRMRIIIASIIDFVDNQPLHKKTTDQLAAEYNITRKVLQQGFKETVGMGVKEYHIQKRMEISKVLLQQGDQSVKQIAQICLYKSQRAFSNAFKKKYFMTPGEYQNQHS